MTHMYDMLHISGVDFESLVNGPGMRTTIFISGCKHFCEGCFSHSTWDFNNGTQCNEKVISDINSEIYRRRELLSGITLSGGDPFYQPLAVADLVDSLYVPCNNLWCYTGFTFEELIEKEINMELLQKIDVLVDGPFKKDLRQLTLRYRGSSNQRIIDVKESLKEGKVKTVIMS